MSESSRFFRYGDVRVRSQWVPRGRFDIPRKTIVHAPETARALPVFLFQHGFQARVEYHGTMLRHLASLGWIVVAPQMYSPGPVSLVGKPHIEDETAAALEVLDWAVGRMRTRWHVDGRLALGGHSRGGDVSWRLAAARQDEIAGVVGFDPVDTGSTPLFPGRSVLAGLELEAATLIIGLGEAGPCSPPGAHHAAFASATPAAGYAIVQGAGHGDVLDRGPALAARALCGGSGSIAGNRAAAVGLAAAHLAAVDGTLGVDLGNVAAVAPAAVRLVSSTDASVGRLRDAGATEGASP